MGFADMLSGLQDPQQLQSPFPSSADTTYGQVQQGVPPEVQAMNQPTTDVAEIDRRKAGWMEVVQRAMSDPNITRAIGLFGSAMGQPFGANDTLAGRFAQSAAVGRSAYDQGLLAQEAATKRSRDELRTQESHDVGMESQRTQTEAARAGIPGTVARGELAQSQARVAQATEDSTITQARLTAEKTALDLENAKTTQEVDKIKLRQAKEHDALLQSIPESDKKAAVVAELHKIQSENDLRAAQKTAQIAAASASKAHAKYFDQESRKTAAEAQNLEDVNKLPVEERAKVKAKSAGTQSAQVQANDQFQSFWKQGNPKSAGESDADYNQRAAQAVTKFMTEKKAGDEFPDFIKFQETFGNSKDTVEQAMAKYKRAKAAMSGTASTSVEAPTAQRGKLGVPVSISGDEEYNRLPSGTKFVGPDGIVRTKP